MRWKGNSVITSRAGLLNYKPRSAVCGDIDNDGIQEAVLFSLDGYLHVWKLPTPEGITNPGLDWPTFHHDPARTGYYQEP